MTNANEELNDDRLDLVSGGRIIHQHPRPVGHHYPGQAAAEFRQFSNAISAQMNQAANSIASAMGHIF